MTGSLKAGVGVDLGDEAVTAELRRLLRAATNLEAHERAKEAVYKAAPALLTALDDLRERQARVGAWVQRALGGDAAHNAQERSLRTVEEAIELAQACGVSAETLHRLVDYVFARPVGRVSQEIAGTLVTLYSTAAALGVDADEAFEREMARIARPEIMGKIQRRQREKREALIGNVP